MRLDFGFDDLKGLIKDALRMHALRGYLSLYNVLIVLGCAMYY